MEPLAIAGCFPRERATTSVSYVVVHCPKRESKSHRRTSQGGDLDGSLLPRFACEDRFRKVPLRLDIRRCRVNNELDSSPAS